MRLATTKRECPALRYPDHEIAEARHDMHRAMQLCGIEGKLRGGELWARCPFHAERSASFHIIFGKGRFKCFGCGESGDAIDLVQRVTGASFPHAVEMLGGRRDAEFDPALLEAREQRQRERDAEEALERQTHLAAAHALYRSGVRVAGTLGEFFLRHARAITAPLGSADLRFHPRAAWFPYAPEWKRRGPAILAAIRHIKRGHIGTHVTYLAPDGKRLADVPKCKKGRKITGELAGGFVRLGRITDAVCVAEGIESALSASEACGLPPMAVLTAGNMRDLLLPPSVRRVIIAHDRDAKRTGELAAEVLAERLWTEGRSVELMPPPPNCGDWNDDARRRAGLLAEHAETTHV